MKLKFLSLYYVKRSCPGWKLWQRSSEFVLAQQEMINRLVCMAHIWALQLGEMTDSEDACAISYLTDDTKRVLCDLRIIVHKYR